MFFKKKKKKYSVEQQFEYEIENVGNDETFKAQCKNLKDNLIDLLDDGIEISDDDESIMQFYLYRDMEITVMYDMDLEAVYVSSPFDVKEYIIESKG